MVWTLNVTLDDDDFEQIKEVKEKLGLTWEEFALQATEALKQREDLE